MCYHDDHRVRAGERQSIFSSVDDDSMRGKIVLPRQPGDVVEAKSTPSAFKIVYPDRRTVDAEQIQRWACEDLYNEERRGVEDWKTVPIAYAVAIVDYYGGVTVAASHGLDLPAYAPNDAVPGVRFQYKCAGHVGVVRACLGETVYCDGSCRVQSPTVDLGDESDESDASDDDEIELSVPLKYEVCPTCEGKGKHVNPSIDGDGLTARDFEDDPDFREDYFSGRYDVTCYGCKGQRVVLELDRDNVDAAVLARIDSMLQERDEDEAERAAERRMGA